MAERLTEHKTTKGITRIVIKPYVEMSEEFQPVADKLCAFEDILEKYGIGIDELENIIINGLAMLDIQKINILKEMELKTDRDTWKRACELACREAPMHCPNPPEYYNAQDEYGSDKPYYIQISACEFSDDVGRCLECQMDYFYQKAKKEGEQK